MEGAGGTSRAMLGAQKLQLEVRGAPPHCSSYPHITPSQVQAWLRCHLPDARGKEGPICPAPGSLEHLICDAHPSRWCLQGFPDVFLEAETEASPG